MGHKAGNVQWRKRARERDISGKGTASNPATRSSLCSPMPSKGHIWSPTVQPMPSFRPLSESILSISPTSVRVTACLVLHFPPTNPLAPHLVLYSSYSNSRQSVHSRYKSGQFTCSVFNVLKVSGSTHNKIKALFWFSDQ